MKTRFLLVLCIAGSLAAASRIPAQPFLPGAQPTPPPRPVPPPVRAQPPSVQYATNPLPAGISAVTPGATAPIPTNAPKIKFDEPNYDFGKIASAQLVRHDFIFTNVGGSTLEIIEVRPSCGCTTAGTWDRKVEPGQTGKIPIQFNPASFSGPMGKSVSVTCNDPTQPTIQLQIRATIWKPIDVTPAYAYFFVTENNLATETRVIRIVNNTEENIELSDLQCTNRAFRAELKPVKPGKEFEVHIGLVPPLGATSVSAPVTVKTSLTNMPLISIHATVMVQPSFQLIPQVLYLPSGPLPSNNVYMVTVQSHAATNIVVTNAAVNVEGATVNLQESQAGRRFTLQVSFPAGYQLQQGRTAELTAKTTHPQHPVIKVPIMQFPAAAPATPPVYRPPVAMTSAPPRSASIAPGSVPPGMRPVPTRPPPPPVSQ